MKQLIQIMLFITLGAVSNMCVAQQIHTGKFQRGDTVYNKRTKVIYVIDSLQYRDPTVKSWTTNFYTAHYPGDTKYTSSDIVESALIKPTVREWIAIRKRLKDSEE